MGRTMTMGCDPGRVLLKYFAVTRLSGWPLSPTEGISMSRSSYIDKAPAPSTWLVKGTSVFEYLNGGAATKDCLSCTSPASLYGVLTWLVKHPVTTSNAAKAAVIRQRPTLPWVRKGAMPAGSGEQSLLPMCAWGLGGSLISRAFYPESADCNPGSIHPPARILPTDLP